MKQLTCEMCGSTDLLKQDGVFVCQSCGTKYSVEEAKKMMVEGTVDIQGTVKVDNSELAEKNLRNARSARQKENWEDAEKYYDLVVQEDPDNLEAVFYGAYAGLRVALYNEDRYKKEQKCDVLIMVFPTIEGAYKKETDKTEIEQLIHQISNDVIRATQSKFVYKTNPPPYAADDIYVYRYFYKLEETYIRVIENMMIGHDTLFWYTILFDHVENLLWLHGLAQLEPLTTDHAKRHNEIIEKMHSINSRIKEINPNHNTKSVPEKEKEGYCYIATAVYGSYDCPQVWTLRRYRDCTLAATWYGRAFIRTYYAISPTLVKWFGHTAWFKRMWQGKLDRMVANLQAKGVESTPYEDRAW